MLNHNPLVDLYDRLFKAYGPQHWWPAETGFEVMVGAVLTQNTAWGNVEKAINNLSQANVLDPESILELDDEELAQFIRPSGYFNVKTQRLKNLCRYLLENGGTSGLESLATDELRQSLLCVHGIGPETADDILLYALNKPVFVIDTYTRRLLKTLGLIQGEEGYKVLRKMFETSLEPDVALYNEYHALIVRHAKEKCSTGEDCRHCRVEVQIEK